MGKAFRELVHYMDVTAQVIKMAVMTIIEYPSNIAGWMISNPLQFIMGFAIIKFVVESFGEDWHGKAPNEEQYKVAMADLERIGEAL